MASADRYGSPVRAAGLLDVESLDRAAAALWPGWPVASTLAGQPRRHLLDAAHSAHISERLLRQPSRRALPPLPPVAHRSAASTSPSPPSGRTSRHISSTQPTRAASTRGRHTQSPRTSLQQPSPRQRATPPTPRNSHASGSAASRQHRAHSSGVSLDAVRVSRATGTSTTQRLRCVQRGSECSSKSSKPDSQLSDVAGAACSWSSRTFSDASIPTQYARDELSELACSKPRSSPAMHNECHDQLTLPEGDPFHFNLGGIGIHVMESIRRKQHPLVPTGYSSSSLSSPSRGVDREAHDAPAAGPEACSKVKIQSNTYEESMPKVPVRVPLRENPPASPLSLHAIPQLRLEAETQNCGASAPPPPSQLPTPTFNALHVARSAASITRPEVKPASDQKESSIGQAHPSDGSVLVGADPEGPEMSRRLDHHGGEALFSVSATGPDERVQDIVSVTETSHRSDGRSLSTSPIHRWPSPPIGSATGLAEYTTDAIDVRSGYSAVNRSMEGTCVGSADDVLDIGEGCHAHSSSAAAESHHEPLLTQSARRSTLSSPSQSGIRDIDMGLSRRLPTPGLPKGWGIGDDLWLDFNPEQPTAMTPFGEAALAAYQLYEAVYNGQIFDTNDRRCSKEDALSARSSHRWCNQLSVGQEDSSPVRCSSWPASPAKRRYPDVISTANKASSMRSPPRYRESQHTRSTSRGTTHLTRRQPSLPFEQSGRQHKVATALRRSASMPLKLEGWNVARPLVTMRRQGAQVLSQPAGTANNTYAAPASYETDCHQRLLPRSANPSSVTSQVGANLGRFAPHANPTRSSLSSSARPHCDDAATKRLTAREPSLSRLPPSPTCQSRMKSPTNSHDCAMLQPRCSSVEVAVVPPDAKSILFKSASIRSQKCTSTLPAPSQRLQAAEGRRAQHLVAELARAREALAKSEQARRDERQENERLRRQLRDAQVEMRRLRVKR